MKEGNGTEFRMVWRSYRLAIPLMSVDLWLQDLHYGNDQIGRVLFHNPHGDDLVGRGWPQSVPDGNDQIDRGWLQSVPCGNAQIGRG
jgi:hypothetical protein